MTVQTFVTDGTTDSWFQVVANKTAEADTGLTRNIHVPAGAVEAVFYLNVTATAGTTPLTDFAIKEVDPVDRTTALAIEGWDGITQIAGTTSGFVTVRIGPGYASTTVDDTGPNYHIGTTLPAILQAVITLDRSTGDETYTYTCSVVFR